MREKKILLPEESLTAEIADIRANLGRNSREIPFLCTSRFESCHLRHAVGLTVLRTTASHHHVYAFAAEPNDLIAIPGAGPATRDFHQSTLLQSLLMTAECDLPCRPAAEQRIIVGVPR